VPIETAETGAKKWSVVASDIIINGAKCAGRVFENSEQTHIHNGPSAIQKEEDYNCASESPGSSKETPRI
jgi:hypothetical protein